jgi:Ni/Co efflux regulator RcnB
MQRFFTSVLTAGLVSSMLAAPLAMAQPQPPGPPHDEQHRQPPPHEQVSHDQPAHMAQRPPEHHIAQQTHQWRHGDHYSGQRRVVTDWSRYHARQPPAGYEWVQDGSQLVLISIASGVIADVLLNAASQ